MPEERPSDAVRNSRMTRARTSESARIEVWAKSAGRCVLCSRYLVGQTGYFHTTLVGQLAHITGATDGTGSPRGQSVLRAGERATAANLMLLCYDCHRRVDSRGMSSYYDEASLIQLKEIHERRVRDATDFAMLAPTMVLSVAARIRGSFAPATDRQISEALRAANLAPGMDDPRDARVDVSLPDSEEADWSWDRARDQIRRSVEMMRERAANHSIGTAAVFAIAPIAVLALLGFYLDDKTDVRVMPANRRDDDARWLWPISQQREVAFDHDPLQPDPVSEDVLVIVSVSGSVDRALMPSEFADVPSVLLTTAELGPEVVDSPATVAAFGSRWRSLMAAIELAYPAAERVHVVAAIPATLAVEIGRAYMKDSQPDLIIYQRRDDSYYSAVTLK